MPKPWEKAGILSPSSADIRAKLRENSRITKPINLRDKNEDCSAGLMFGFFKMRRTRYQSHGLAPGSWATDNDGVRPDVRVDECRICNYAAKYTSG